MVESLPTRRQCIITNFGSCPSWIFPCKLRFNPPPLPEPYDSRCGVLPFLSFSGVSYWYEHIVLLVVRYVGWLYWIRHGLSSTSPKTLMVFTVWVNRSLFAGHACIQQRILFRWIPCTFLYEKAHATAFFGAVHWTISYHQGSHRSGKSGNSGKILNTFSSQGNQGKTGGFQPKSGKKFSNQGTFFSKSFSTL